MIKINVISMELGEIRQFNFCGNFEKAIKKVQYIKNRMNVKNGNFAFEYETTDENGEFQQKTFYDFDSFKKALKELTK